MRKVEALRLQPGEQVTFWMGRDRKTEAGTVLRKVRNGGVKVRTTDRERWVPHDHVIACTPVNAGPGAVKMLTK